MDARINRREFLLLTLCSCNLNPSIFNNTGNLDSNAPSPGGVFGPSSTSPDLWLAWNGPRASSLDNLGFVIDELTTKDANERVTTAESSGQQSKKPTVNGEGIYFNAVSAFRLGAVDTFKSFHTGTAWTMYLSFFYIPQAEATTFRSILSTNGSSSTNSSPSVGIKVGIINSSTTNHSLRVAIFNATGGATGPFDVTCTANTLVQNAYNEFKIVFTGSALTVYVRNANNTTFTQVGTDSSGSGLSSANQNANMVFGVAGAAGTGFTGYLKHVVAWHRNLTGQESTDMESWLATETADVVAEAEVPVYLWWGQSNADPGSSTDNSTLAADQPELAGLLNGYCYSAYGSVYTNDQNYWNQLEASRCNSTSTKHNFILRLGRQINADKGYPAYFIGAGLGSTQLIDRVGGVDWYADGGVATVGDMFPNWKLIVTSGLLELKHVMRKRAKIRGILQWQGENDAALADASTYRAALENWIQSAITFINGLGYSTADTHYICFRIVSSGPQSDVVRTAQSNVMTNFTTDFPAVDIDGLTLIDTDSFDYLTNHVTNDGMSQAGQAAADVLIPLLP